MQRVKLLLGQLSNEEHLISTHAPICYHLISTNIIQKCDTDEDADGEKLHEYVIIPKNEKKKNRERN